MKYKIVEGKIYKEISTNDLEQVRLKVEQVINCVTPLQNEIKVVEAEIASLENAIKAKRDKIAERQKRIDEYINAVDVELIKAAFPEQAKRLGFLTQQQM
jgi:peptidoglycan hydrolase CwlO-like protein